MVILMHFKFQSITCAVLLTALTACQVPPATQPTISPQPTEQPPVMREWIPSDHLGADLGAIGGLEFVDVARSMRNWGKTQC